MIRRALLLSIACLAIAAPAASANPTQVSILQDDKLILRDGQQVRDARLDEFRALGVEVVKITVEWRDLAPGGGSKPQGFDGQGPGEYPDAKWAPYDAAIAGAKARGMDVLIMVSGPAPDWATAGRSEPAGILRPDAAEFGRFVRAVGTRYSGSYTPPAVGGGGGGGGGGGPLPIPTPAALAPSAGAAQAGQPLPRVTLWSVWNEPGLPRFLLPQRSGGGTPVSPHLYRRLYLAAQEGLNATGHGQDTILVGELLPVGKSSRGTRSSIRPLEFMREFACVNSKLRAYRGSAARSRGCTGYRSVSASGLAFHPYTLAGGPRVRPRHRDDASIGTLSRVTRLLDRLGKRKRLSPRRAMPLWLTEFGFQSDPPDIFGADLRRIPDFMGESERLAFRNRRVRSYSQYPLVDDSANAGFQSGLRFSDGREKPGVYRAFEMPFSARRVSRSRVELFGGVRSASGGEVVIESRRRRSRTWRQLGTAKLNSRGYFSKRFRVSGKREFRAVSGGKRSNSGEA
ncbi:MAG TPA: hypothetical protein VNT32_06200 [Thermoleophilaceae bacterium]|nr:hypothetical protein [Thermoleophilaceae bacterium]